MSSAPPSRRWEVVRLDLEFGSYELGVDECRELIRILHRRGEQPDGEAALLGARRLEAVLDQHPEVDSARGVTEEQLDAVADAAWEWLQRVDSNVLPERVLLLLDVLRARHVHE